MKALEIQGLSVSYDGRAILSQLNLAVERAEICGLVGRTGSGKSTLAAAALGLLPGAGKVASGSVKLLGREVTRDSKRAWSELRHRSVAYIPQHPRAALHPYLRVGRQLEHVLKSRGLRASLDRRLELLERVQIRDPGRVVGAFPHELSGGMAQRVAIAMALICDPAVVFADEPTSGLDVTIQRDILELLVGVTAGRSVVLITHDLGIVRRYCTSVAVLHQGRIVERGDVERVFVRPRHEYTKTLIRAL